METAERRTTGLLVWAIGLALVLAAVWVLFTRTALSSFIPTAVVLAVILLIVGLAVMGMSRSAGWWGRDRAIVRETYTGPTAGPYAGRGEYVEREVRTYEDDRGGPL